MSSSRAAVDTARAASLSFAPPEPTAPPSIAILPAPRTPVPFVVRPGRHVATTVPGSGGLLGEMSEYPIQIEKVQAPPLRDDILSRDRLLDWLNVKIHNRVVLLTAEAGYGKTTLLADFARRTRLRVLWYRLDRGDRDWVGFIAYLVAAVRVHIPAFGPATASLLREVGSSAPPLQSVLDTFLRELAELGSEPTALVLDDFHLVDDSDEVRQVLRELIGRAPERLSLMIASRRTPPLRLARLRALGELAELRTAELRFDQAETERLFHETYAMPIEASLLTEVSRRTEGWAASLQLVRAALRDRDAPAVRAFVHSLSGGEGHLYDYLAEEVVGDLPNALQDFLMRTSVLGTIDLTLGSVAAETSIERTRSAIDEAERRGLLGRQRADSRYVVRAHPLVRGFLQTRLERSVGREAVSVLHQRVAAAAESVDWRLAATHYLAAGASADASRVLSDSLEIILATGAYASADAIAKRLPDEGASSFHAIIQSRVSLKAGDSPAAQAHARMAVALEPSSDVAVWNALMIALSCGAFGELETYASRLRSLKSTQFRRISADAVVAIVDSSVDGPLVAAESLMAKAGEAATDAGHSHFLGVSLLNQAQLRRARGDAGAALELAERAIAALEMTSSGIELVSARLTRAWALAHLGSMEDARAEIELSKANAVRTLEFAFEAADIEVFYGSVDRAELLMLPVEEPTEAGGDLDEQALLTRVSIDIVRGRLEDAAIRLTQVAWGQASTSPGTESKRRALRAYLATIRGDDDATQLSQLALAHSRSQGAELWVNFAQAIRVASEKRVDIQPVYLSMAAEAVVQSLPTDSELMAAVRTEAARRPERWRPPLRLALEAASLSTALAAGALLDEVGDVSDIPRLRRTARRLRPGAPALGRGLSRRLAPHAWISDLGHVEIQVGDRRIQGTEVRRKVLALLCFLLTKRGFRAQREEVLEALWPEFEPNSALNSLNQTTYFLRRVFEPDYSDDLSPGYVGQTSEFIWLDAELVHAQSDRAGELIRAAARGTPDQILEAVEGYPDRFALDFIYEDWAAPFREGLHAAYLHLVESSLHSDIDTGNFLRGIEVAQAAAAVEPDSEQIQASLVKLYRLAGAHAAAAEQFARYSAFLRDLGVEPPRIEDV
ncbi:MAG TPA: AAA family ATPase [Candidatus Limnocylindrales bacterium]